MIFYKPNHGIMLDNPFHLRMSHCYL